MAVTRPPSRPVPGRRGIVILTSRGVRLPCVSRVVPEDLSITPFRCVRRPFFQSLVAIRELPLGGQIIRITPHIALCLGISRS